MYYHHLEMKQVSNNYKDYLTGDVCFDEIYRRRCVKNLWHHVTHGHLLISSHRKQEESIQNMGVIYRWYIWMDFEPSYCLVGLGELWALLAWKHGIARASCLAGMGGVVSGLP
jgi:hypothetical protein